MNLILNHTKLKGNIYIPSDKSFCHRTIISAFLASGLSEIHNVNMCDDVKNTINIIRQICDVEIDGNFVSINSEVYDKNLTFIDIDESASTLRLLLPVLSFLMNKKIEFKLGKRLKERGIEEYKNILINNNFYYKEKDDSIYVKGFPDLDEYHVSTKESSQYTSGIIFLASILKHDTKIIIDSAKNSIGYIDLTIKNLNYFGAEIKREENIIYIKSKKLTPKNIEAPADSSVALFVSVLNEIGSDINIKNKSLEESNPDYNLYKIVKNKEYKNINEFDISLNPDSIFSLSLLNFVDNKEIIFKNIKRLKNKESDRIKSLVYFLNQTKSMYYLNEDELIIKRINPNIENINIFNDHRMIMFVVGISTVSSTNIEINNKEAIKKSYKNFYEDFHKLGLTIKEINKRTDFEYNLGKAKSKVYIGRAIDEINLIENDSKILFVIDKNIKNEEIEKIKHTFFKNQKHTDFYYLEKNKEDVKTLEEAEKIFLFLLKNKYEKKDYVVAVGGGTVTDLVSFVASNYKRGINLITIPTTLLAMVDASIGGKNGINIKTTKNAIGNFYLPKYTIVDTDFLKTLDEKEKRNGMAEIIKIFSLKNQKYFFDIYDSAKYDNLDEWIIEAIKEKIDYVMKDPFDKNKRMALNFGHTIGHAIELEYKVSHGEAVINGMVCESNNKLILDLLIKYGFDVIDDLKYKENIYNDKKIDKNKISMVKLEKIGQYKIIKKDVDRI